MGEMAPQSKSIDNDLTPAQKNTLESFKEAIRKEGLYKEDDPDKIEVDDPTLLSVLLLHCRFLRVYANYSRFSRRFLKARNFNLNNSLTMFRNCLRWRQSLLGVGMTALYERTDPWEVNFHTLYVEAFCIHFLISIRNVNWFYPTGPSGSTR